MLTMPPGYEARRERLWRLRGLPCPCCRLRGLRARKLVWNGLGLSCGARHGYSNPDVLIQEAREAAGCGSPSTRGPYLRRKK